MKTQFLYLQPRNQETHSFSARNSARFWEQLKNIKYTFIKEVSLIVKAKKET